MQTQRMETFMASLRILINAQAKHLISHIIFLYIFIFPL